MEIYTRKLRQPPGYPYKFFSITRLSILFLFIGVLQVSATANGQRITLKKKEIKIKEVFKAIKSQTGFDVLWQPDSFDTDKKIKIDYSDMKITEVMKECLAGTGLVFEIQDVSIVIKKSLSRINLPFKEDSLIYKGQIMDENKKPLVGATLKVVGSNRSTFTNSNGNFAIYGPRKGTLEITYIGYLSKQLTLNGLDSKGFINISMIPGNNNLGEVTIVSTGYQDIPKERATGSFEVITKEQLQHSSDVNLIKRLEGITTSMNFNNQLSNVNSANFSVLPTSASESPLAKLTIRGKNTLNPIQSSYLSQSGLVLVVIDGIASPYPIDNIDPNDVESITVLKDAAAASVWGSKAANGVIVVKTKRGEYNKPLSISYNSNFNISRKVDLFYKNTMSTSDYIDAQVFQFNAARTKVDAPVVGIRSPFLSPVSEILGRQQNGQLSASQVADQLDALRGNDLRKDFEKYILRDGFNQSYSLGLDGGSKNFGHHMSLAYNRTTENTVGAESGRLTLAYNTSFKPVKNLDVNLGVNYSIRSSENQAPEGQVSAQVLGLYFYPYTRIVDDQGNPIAIPYKYRPAFVDLLATTYGDKIQDLHYFPLENINQGYWNTTYKSLNFNLGATYKLNSIFSGSVIYNYGIGENNIEKLNKKESFYIRDLVTYYTSPAGVKSIPFGGFYSITNTSTRFQSFRGQLNSDYKWSEKNVLNAIAGVEAMENYVFNIPFQYYGYNENTRASNNQLDFVDNVPTLFDTGFGANARIPAPFTTISDAKFRTYSVYTNAAYTYNRLYTLSASARKDLSSEFGAGTNRSGAPYFSLGGKWNLAQENFYNINFLPVLQVRATFGYNGNVNPQILARQLIGYSTSTEINGYPYATAQTGSGVTNERLRPEKTGVLNLGIDFGFKNGRLSGSLEYYNKKTTDLIAGNSLDPSTGFNRLPYNTANLHGWGADFSLNSQNLQAGSFSWSSNFLFSYNRVKVSKLFSANAKTAQDGVSGSPAYNEGADLSRVYGYRWAGLDPINGGPRGYLNGIPVTLDNRTYTAFNNQPISSLRYFGSASPVYYGSFRNTLRYGALSVSANIMYSLGYYFRRPMSDVVAYVSLFGLAGNNSLQGAEYANRWQKPGDENITNVPSIIYPVEPQRDSFYYYSEINVQRADHIRLQEINISYMLNKKDWFLKNPRIYTNISNLGIIWRANKLGLDPDIADYPRPKTYAFGISANF